MNERGGKGGNKRLEFRNGREETSRIEDIGSLVIKRNVSLEIERAGNVENSILGLDATRAEVEGLASGLDKLVDLRVAVVEGL